jgi:hypothetical protein
MGCAELLVEGGRSMSEKWSDNGFRPAAEIARLKARPRDEHLVVELSADVKHVVKVLARSAGQTPSVYVARLVEERLQREGFKV